MRIFRNRYFQDILIGFTLGLGIGAGSFWAFGGFETVPYTKVELVQITEDQNTILFTANFFKNDDCEFNSWGVFGRRLGVWDPIPSIDMEGEQGDRLEGDQTLNLQIFANPEDYEPFEVRTRHICTDNEGKAEKVDRVFYRFGVEDVHQIY